MPAMEMVVLGRPQIAACGGHRRWVGFGGGGGMRGWRREELASGRRPSVRQPQGTVEELKPFLWGSHFRSPLCTNSPLSRSREELGKSTISGSFSRDSIEQQSTSRAVSRREWLLVIAALAAVAYPGNAHGLDVGDTSTGNSGTAANGDIDISSGVVQKSSEDVKSWYRYRGEGFVIRVPPGYEDVLDPTDEEESGSLYGERAKERPFAARFASPDRDEVLSIVVKPATQLRLSFFETKDISDFGSIKDAAGKFVPAGAQLVSARIINSKASQTPRTYYVYEFLVKGMHFTMSAGVARGRVFVLGASAPADKWKDYGTRLQLAASTFFLP